jgi:hypothetical protein
VFLQDPQTRQMLRTSAELELQSSDIRQKARSAPALVILHYQDPDGTNFAFDRCSIGELHKAYSPPSNIMTVIPLARYQWHATHDMQS